MGRRATDSELPLSVDLAEKMFTCMGSTTGAAAAASAGIIADSRGFYLLYSLDRILSS